MDFPLAETLMNGWKRPDGSPAWFTLSGDTLDGLVWQDDVVARPTDAEILSKQQEFSANPPLSNPKWRPFLKDITASLYSIIQSHSRAIIDRIILLASDGTDWEDASDPIFVYWNQPSPLY